ncbi:MAG: hypothetical protein JWO95_3361, partial [Verrucomicrobiales bacterium]|nr:hypothetical protein [Verrucomicrobiales bacterium]
WQSVTDMVVQTNPGFLFKCSGEAALVGGFYHSNACAVTKSIDMSSGGRLSFFINAFSCSGTFDYSTNNGQSWTEIHTFTSQECNASWVFVDMDAPVAAKSVATLFRWHKTGVDDGILGLDRVRISTPNHSGPYFRWMPSDRITYPGSIVNLRPEVEGTAPMKFQWCKDGAPVASLTEQNLVLGNIQTNQAGAYTLVISNQFWAITSSVVNIGFTSVPYRPRIWSVTDHTGGNQQERLEASGAFAQIYHGAKDLNDISYKDFSPYDAMLFEMDLGQSFYDAFGDNAADYVDSGVGFVASVFFGPQQTFGRLTAENYLPFTTGGGENEQFATTFFDVPTHPILSGVMRFTNVWGDGWGTGSRLVPGSKLIAHWSDGSPFIGTKQKAGSGRVVGYNADFQSQPTKLVANALLWAAREPAPEPRIVAEPHNVGVTPGTFASVVAYVSGASPMGFQWYRNGSLIPGAMDSAYNVVYPQMGDDATYTYIATNAYGSVASTATVLTVQVGPAITAQPQSVTVHSGDNGSLSVGATGTSLQYQWYKDGDVLAGATFATLSIGNVSLADDADYSVQVWNLVGSQTSLTVHLTPLVAPILLQQPVSQTVQAGGAVTFSCSVGPDRELPPVSSGQLTLWLDANAKVDADSNNLISSWRDCSSNHWNAAQSDPNWQPVLTHPEGLNGRAAVHFEDYSISGSFLTNSTLSFQGAYTAFLVYLHAATSPGFMTPFQMDSFDADQFKTGRVYPFAGFALWPKDELGVVGWDWFHSGISMPPNTWHVETVRQHTDSVVDIMSESANAATNTTIVEGGNYSFHNSYHLGALAGDIAEVVVYQGALSDVEQASVGQFLHDKYFLNTVRGFGFQWQLNGVDIAGATNQTLQLAGVQASQSGSYTVVVSNTGGTATSTGAVLSVNGPGAPQVTIQPQTHAVNFGDTVVVSVTATGNSPMSYQWLKDGAPISGATHSSFSINGFSAGDAAGGYSVRISNNAGSVTSATASIGVPPQIVQQPQSVVVPLGQSFQAAVAASGTGLSYQWLRLNGTLPDGLAMMRFETNAVYGRAVSTAKDDGTYAVAVKNVFGVVTSAVFTVTTATAPYITQQPASVTVAENATFLFPAHVEGGALSYQWYKDGSPIAGGTQENYNAWRNIVAFGGSNTATLSDAGSYYLVATNIVGSATSDTVTLTVTNDSSMVLINSLGSGSSADYSGGIKVSGFSKYIWEFWPIDPPTLTLNGSDVYQTTRDQQYQDPWPWRCTIPQCPPGLNTLVATVRRHDGALFHWTTTFYNSVAITLQGGVNGPGTVSPNLFGTKLNFGSNYVMTATPSTGAFFTGWSTDAGIICTDRTLKFTMTTDLHLYANFVSDPFASVLGSFNGLFSDDVVTARTAGSLTVKLSKKGAYSGTLKRAGKSYPISGKFDLSGHAAPFVRALNGKVDMQVDFERGQITGAIINDVSQTPLRAVRAPFCATNQSMFSGKYTMALPANASLDTGHGFGCISQMPDGTIKLMPPSALGDGTAVSQSVGVGGQGEWPIYVSVNKGTGLLFGWLNFSNAPARTLSGTVNWIRPNCSSAEIQISASLYTPSATGFGVNATSLTAVCEGGCLTQCTSNAVLVAKTPVTVLSPNTNAMSLKISSPNGFVSGSFKVAGKVKMIKGVVLQQQTNGAGFFVDTPKNGAVSLK